MNYLPITDFDFNIQNGKLPVNIYALRVLDNNNNITYDIIINHNGYCPNLNSERDESRFNDYLSNLENEVINHFFIVNNIQKPKDYSNLFEIITNKDGKLYHYSKVVNK